MRSSDVSKLRARPLLVRPSQMRPARLSCLAENILMDVGDGVVVVIVGKVNRSKGFKAEF